MADADWRAAERRWRADPSDHVALTAAIDAMRRTGVIPPADLLDARVEPARTIDVPMKLDVWAVGADGREEPVGWGPGPVDVPACRVWGVTADAGMWRGVDPQRQTDEMRAVGALVREQRVPGLRLRSGWRITSDEVLALGAQPHLRWLELPESYTDSHDVAAFLETTASATLERLRVPIQEGPRAGRLALVEHQRRLRDLELWARDLEPADLGAIEVLPELVALSIPHNPQVAPRHLAALGLADRLRDLTIGCTQERALTDDDLGRLAALRSLERLKVYSSSDLSTARATTLAGASRLRELTLDGAFEVGEAAFGAWADGLHELEALRVAGAFLTDTALASVARLRRLRTIELTPTDWADDPADADLTDAGLEPLGALEHLSALALRAELVTGSSLSGLTRLERLSFEPCTDVGLLAISRLPRLRELEVAGPFTGAGLSRLASLRGLEQLTVHGGDAGDVFSFLGDLTRLESLSITGRIGDPTLEVISRLPRLRRLDLCCSEGTITREGVARLRALPLRTLRLNAPLVTSAELAVALGDHPTLRRLVLFRRAHDVAPPPGFTGFRDVRVV